MKLYTEEQVKEMIDDAHNGIDGYYDIFKKHTPIEIPSDEEIDAHAHKVHDDLFNEFYAYTDGAKWMRNQILNKIK